MTHFHWDIWVLKQQYLTPAKHSMVFQLAKCVAKGAAQMVYILVMILQCGRRLSFICPVNVFSLPHYDVIKWKHFPPYWPFVRGIHWSPVNSPHKGQWSGVLMFSSICAWTNGCANNRDITEWRCHGAHYDVTVMLWVCGKSVQCGPYQSAAGTLGDWTTHNIPENGASLPTGTNSTRVGFGHWLLIIATGLRAISSDRNNTYVYVNLRLKKIRIITVTSQWARWRLKSPAPRLFTLPFVQA